MQLVIGRGKKELPRNTMGKVLKRRGQKVVLSAHRFPAKAPKTNMVFR
ncbi:MAG: hypothetical protein GY850_36570 [bacterium]|nr:hypothetical protein [bacterium]